MTDLFTVSLIFSTIRLSTPLVLAALGGMFSERSGVINIALEGMMLAGAFTAAALTYATGSPWIGLAAAAGAGVLVASIHAVASIRYRADQVVVGTAINILMIGLPGFLSGLGVNTNYSYIESSGLPNTFLNTGSPVNLGSIPPGNLPLEGLSKHNVNASVFYENERISLRAAYNWRSRFLLTAADVIFPYTSIFNEATGQLDASIFINLNQNIKFGVQGVNLLNEVTKTSQAYSGDPDRLAPRSYFMNDRRFSFIIRGNF